MENAKNFHLTANQHKALQEIKETLKVRFDIKEFVLYGSVAREQAEEESDIDLLVVTSKSLNRFERHEITDAVFDVNLKYDTNFSTLVVDQNAWETGFISVLPVRNEILKDGVRV